MRIVIAGGHGKIALLLSRQLKDAGHEPVGMIRNPDQAADLHEAGAVPLLLDLEHSTVEEVAATLVGADAAVFAAGAGEGSGNDRKLTVDRDGAIRLADAAAAAGVRRLVIVSSAGADSGAESGDDFSFYLKAKADADAAVRATGLDWTIVRPVALVDDAPTGLVTTGVPEVQRGSIPRADVAAVIVAAIVDGTAIHSQFEVTTGDTPIAEALRLL